MRKTLLATAMIVPFVLLAIWPLATAHADNEKLPMTYVAAMSGIQGNLVARAANCGFAGDRAADLRRIIIAAAASSGLSLVGATQPSGHPGRNPSPTH